MTHRALIAIPMLALALAAAWGSSRSTQLASATSATRSSFGPNVTNPWFSLRAGSVYVYRGVKDGQPSRDVMTVTRRTRMIDGARCVAVSDLLYLSGRLGERTTDYYTQDSKGNVWYFGEKTAELDTHGHITNTSGTWRAGVDGAKPGIYMPAHPHVGQSGLQEYYKGQAEDHFKVVSLFGPVAGPKSSDGLLTKEWSPLEPGVLDHKMYVRGVGTVLEQ